MHFFVDFRGFFTTIVKKSFFSLCIQENSKIMFSQKLQKLTSLCLIFFLLFSITLRVPVELFLGYSAYAAEKEFYNLVSIVVDEESYDELRTKLVRYSRDIQSNLENTRVVILPTPSDASVLDIASLNESLYFE